MGIWKKRKKKKHLPYLKWEKILFMESLFSKNSELHS